MSTELASAGTVNVRIRHEDESTGIPLCAWDPTDLDGLINLLKRWGLSYDYASEQPELSGQFVVADGEAFFEILVHAPEDGSR